jgi:hypothetical protein
MFECPNQKKMIIFFMIFDLMKMNQLIFSEFKPNEKKLYILGLRNTASNKPLLCTAKFKDNKVVSTNWDKTDFEFMKTMAQWIITSGECSLPGNELNNSKYMLVENDLSV